MSFHEVTAFPIEAVNLPLPMSKPPVLAKAQLEPEGCDDTDVNWSKLCFFSLVLKLLFLAD